LPSRRTCSYASSSPANASSGLTWLILAVVTFVLLSAAGQIVGFYTDWLWFGEVQFTSVFITILRTQILLGLATGVAFFAILYGNVALAWRLAPREALVEADDALGLPSPEILRPYLRRLTLPVSVTLALLAGWLGTNRWELVLKALNPTPFGIRDPLFEREVAFYVFQLPLWNSLCGWLMAVLILSGLATIAVSFCTRGIQVLSSGVSILSTDPEPPPVTGGRAVSREGRRVLAGHVRPPLLPAGRSLRRRLF
jgi:uncharacterized protein